MKPVTASADAPPKDAAARRDLATTFKQNFHVLLCAA